MYSMRKTAFLGAALIISANAIGGETLRVADSFPVGHYISDSLIGSWMKEVELETKGEVKFQFFPAQQMGKAKDMLELLRSGAIDIAYIGVSYFSDKMPLASIGELAADYSSSCVGSAAYWKLARPGGLLDELEYSKEGIRLISEMVLAPYQIVTSRKEITNLDSLKGLKIRATGDTKEMGLINLGMTPVALAAPDIRDGLSRGTIDGSLGPMASLAPYGLDDVTKYSTEGSGFGTFIATYAINVSRWNRLPESVKIAMNSATAKVLPSACARVDKLEEESKKEMIAKGLKFVRFDSADQARINEALAKVGDDWAKAINKNGREGTKVLDAFRAAVAEAKASGGYGK